MSNANQYRNNAYGVSQALSNLAQLPIIGNRAPLTSDISVPLGTIWVYPAVNGAWVLTSIAAGAATWTNVAGGAGVFTSITVNPGPSVFTSTGNGAFTVGNATNTGLISFQVGTGNFSIVGNAHTIGIGNDAAANTVTVGSTTGAATTTINGGTGGLVLAPTAGNATLAPATGTVAGTALTLNAHVGTATFTGLTTASAASQTLTITNNLVTTTSAILISLTHLNASANGALLRIADVTISANTIAITYTNSGANPLGAGDDVRVTWWAMS